MIDEPIDKAHGRDVMAVRAKLTKTGDGLSKSLGIAPVLLSHGDTVIVVCRAKVAAIGTVPHTTGDLAGPLDYLYTFAADTMVLANTPQNRKLLDRMASQINQRAQIPGQKSIDDELGDTDTDAEVVPLRPDDWGDDGNER